MQRAIANNKSKVAAELIIGTPSAFEYSWHINQGVRRDNINVLSMTAHQHGRHFWKSARAHYGGSWFHEMAAATSEISKVTPLYHRSFSIDEKVVSEKMKRQYLLTLKVIINVEAVLHGAWYYAYNHFDHVLRLKWISTFDIKVSYYYFSRRR